jgi:hypothetical protein
MPVWYTRHIPMKNSLAALLMLSLVVSARPAHAQSADAIQKRLEAESVKLREWVTDPVVLGAVVAQNGQHLEQAEIEARDRAWTEGQADALVKSVTAGPCATRLRELAASGPQYGEVLLMDEDGALVCATNKTSDYWQGDEPKWARAFDQGKGSVFIDRPRFDESANERLAQISLPVTKSGEVVGVITVGVKLD